MTKAFDRGANAARRGRSLESNPFARRGQVKRAAQWAEGWNSVDYRPVVVPDNWKWPPIAPMPVTQSGDYWVRERGLDMLFRPGDLLEYDVLRAEMRLGLVSYVPKWARIPYVVLWAFAADRRSLGEECLEPVVGSHPLKWLCSVIRQQGPGSHWPSLVTTAYEELINGPLLKSLLEAHLGDQTNWDAGHPAGSVSGEGILGEGLDKEGRYGPEGHRSPLPADPCGHGGLG